jgi:hypothetical protein
LQIAGDEDFMKATVMDGAGDIRAMNDHEAIKMIAN